MTFHPLEAQCPTGVLRSSVLSQNILSPTGRDATLVADAVCFLKGRPHFHYVTGERAKANSGAPIALIAYGQRNAEALRKADLGKVVAA